jgi:hypothetical protein
MTMGGHIQHLGTMQWIKSKFDNAIDHNKSCAEPVFGSAIAACCVPVLHVGWLSSRDSDKCNASVAREVLILSLHHFNELINMVGSV